MLEGVPLFLGGVPCFCTGKFNMGTPPTQGLPQLWGVPAHPPLGVPSARGFPRESRVPARESQIHWRTPKKRGFTVKQWDLPLPGGFSAPKVPQADLAPLRTRACAQAPKRRARGRRARSSMAQFAAELLGILLIFKFDCEGTYGCLLTYIESS